MLNPHPRNRVALLVLLAFGFATPAAIAANEPAELKHRSYIQRITGKLQHECSPPRQIFLARGVYASSITIQRPGLKFPTRVVPASPIDRSGDYEWRVCLGYRASFRRAYPTLLAPYSIVREVQPPKDADPIVVMSAQPNFRVRTGRGFYTTVARLTLLAE